MATNALGNNTRNHTLNFPVDELRLVGRLACNLNISVGALIKRAMLRGLETEYPELAKEIQSVRQKHRLAARIVGIKVAGSLLLGFFVWITATSSPDIRRPRRRDEIEVEVEVTI